MVAKGTGSVADAKVQTFAMAGRDIIECGLKNPAALEQFNANDAITVGASLKPLSAGADVHDKERWNFKGSCGILRGIAPYAVKVVASAPRAASCL